jgi:hypothetical protein
MSALVRTSAPAAQTGQTDAELLVKSLEAQGVDYVFGAPGGKIDGVFNSLLDSKIRTIVCRHEPTTRRIRSLRQSLRHSKCTAR